mgnify:CR=1 FL=1|jgi:hypothetical protein
MRHVLYVEFIAVVSPLTWRDDCVQNICMEAWGTFRTGFSVQSRS